MKSVKETQVQELINECFHMYHEYQKVKMAVNLKGKLTVLSGMRLIDTTDTEHFIVKDQNNAYYSFSAAEVLKFEVVSLVKEEIDMSYNPISKLQKTIADKIHREKTKNAQESEAIADELSASVGYFPLLKSATGAGLTIDFLNNVRELQDSIFFPFVKGEVYEVFSHEDDREIEIHSLMVDVSIATNADNDEEASPDLFAKYYETYKAIQDLEFVPDNNHIEEIFLNYKLDSKYSKVVGDLNKHDLLVLVKENAGDVNIIEAAKDLRSKKKTSSKIKP